MSTTEPRTDITSVRDEPGFDGDEFADSAIDIKIGDAHRIVERRLADSQFAEDTLTRVETLVTAHLLTPALTGATQGKQYESVQQESATVKFAINESLPAGIDSPFWQQAADLTDGEIDRIDGAHSVGVR